MKIILASSNAGKEKEFKKLLSKHEIINYNKIIEPFEIDESGDSFASNALIKANAVFLAIKEQNPKALKNSAVLSDDSGISVSALNWAPGIYSARYSADLVANPNEQSNRDKLKSELKRLNLASSPAFYTAALGLVCSFGAYVAHGFMYGEAIDEERGDQGFGYDFMFIPSGFDKTIGQLPPELKEQLSHRSKALANIIPVINMLEKKYKE